MSTGTEGLADMMNAALEHTIPVAYRMGVRIDVAEPGHAVATVPFEGNGNHFGVMYAGVEFTVAEVLGGVIALSTFDAAKYFPLVKNIEIAFVGMGKSALRAEARMSDAEIDRVAAEAEANGKSDFVLDAVVTGDDGQTVATTRGLYQLRAHGK